MRIVTRLRPRRGMAALAVTLLGLVAASVSACSVQSASEPGLLVRPTVDDDPALPALDLNGTRLHVESRGLASGPVVVFLHGGPGGDYRYMLGLADPEAAGALGADHRLVFWDQRGTGLSRRHAREDVTMEAYQADLEALVDAVSPGAPVVLVGHSWGGAYASWYMGRHPDRVRGAVLIDPQAINHTLYAENGPAAATELLAEWVSDPLWSREIVSPDDHARADFWLASLELHRIPRFGNHDVTPQFRPGSVVFKYLDYRWFDDNAYDFGRELDRFTRPVWILAGTEDQVLGESFQRRQVALFRDARLVPLPGDGHNDTVMRSAPRTIAHVRAYLDALGALP